MQKMKRILKKQLKETCYTHTHTHIYNINAFDGKATIIDASRRGRWSNAAMAMKQGNSRSSINFT